jgi:hypothetical protein
LGSTTWFWAWIAMQDRLRVAPRMNSMPPVFGMIYHIQIDTCSCNDTQDKSNRKNKTAAMICPPVPAPKQSKAKLSRQPHDAPANSIARSSHLAIPPIAIIPSYKTNSSRLLSPLTAPLNPAFVWMSLLPMVGGAPRRWGVVRWLSAVAAQNSMPVYPTCGCGLRAGAGLQRGGGKSWDALRVFLGNR